MERSSGLTYQPALDGLRALAVAAVIAFHLGAGWMTGGFLGVDAFFVLSGYLITSLLLHEWDRRQTINLSGFWARRARRLLPALLLVLSFIALYAIALAPSNQLRALRADELASLFYVANWHFVLNDQWYFGLFTLPSPMRHLWSLAIEEQFYLVWPFVVFACLRLGRGSRSALTCVCAVGIVASASLMALLYNPANPSRVYYGTDARAHTILVGALLALLLGRWKPRTRRETSTLNALGMVVGAICIWAFIDVTHGPALYHGGYIGFAIGVAVVIASAVQPNGGLIRAFLSLRLLRWIGMISYGLYLWHWPIIIVLDESRTGLSGTPLAVVRLAATFGAATLSFYLVEQPIRRGALRGWRVRIATPAAFGSAALLFIVTTAGAGATRLEPAQARNTVSSTSELGGAGQTGGHAFASGPRILLVGDSVPSTLLPGLQPLAAKRGVMLDTALVDGCGVVGGVATYVDGTIPSNAQGCEGLVDAYERESIARDRPQLVVWMSTSEVSDRMVNGELIRFGAQAWDRMMLGKIDEAVTRLTSQGAHLVITTVAARAPSDVAPSSPEEDVRYDRLNELYQEYGRAHPEKVSIVDFAKVVCPDGPPCPRRVGGVNPRPLDGLHFTPESARWAAPRLLNAVLSCRPSALGWGCSAIGSEHQRK